MRCIPARNGMDVPAGIPARENIKLMAFSPAEALNGAGANKVKSAELGG
ncbi:hypothetical protein [Cribrihabitans pelagius]